MPTIGSVESSQWLKCAASQPVSPASPLPLLPPPSHPWPPASTGSPLLWGRRFALSGTLGQGLLSFSFLFRTFCEMLLTLTYLKCLHFTSMFEGSFHWMWNSGLTLHSFISVISGGRSTPICIIAPLISDVLYFFRCFYDFLLIFGRAWGQLLMG